MKPNTSNRLVIQKLFTQSLATFLHFLGFAGNGKTVSNLSASIERIAVFISNSFNGNNKRKEE